MSAASDSSHGKNWFFLYISAYFVSGKSQQSCHGNYIPVKHSLPERHLNHGWRSRALHTRCCDQGRGFCFFLIYFIYYSVFLFCPAVLGPGRLLHVLLPSQISDLVSSSGTLSCTKVNSAAVMHYIREHSLDNLSLSCTCAARPPVSPPPLFSPPHLPFHYTATQLVWCKRQGDPAAWMGGPSYVRHGTTPAQLWKLFIFNPLGAFLRR